jgi:hypothetical protein
MLASRAKLQATKRARIASCIRVIAMQCSFAWRAKRVASIRALWISN